MLVYLFILLRRLPWRPFSSWLWFLPGPSRRSGTRKTWERIITTFLLFRWKNPGNIKWEMPRSTLSLSLLSHVLGGGPTLSPTRGWGARSLAFRAAHIPGTTRDIRFYPPRHGGSGWPASLPIRYERRGWAGLGRETVRVRWARPNWRGNYASAAN